MLTLILASVAVSSFVSMCLILGASIGALHRQTKQVRRYKAAYGRLLARYVASMETLPELPDWVNGYPSLKAGAIQVLNKNRKDPELRTGAQSVLNRNARYDTPPDKGDPA